MANTNIAKLVYENVMNSHMDEIELVGLELTHASGVRAIAADTAIRERGGRKHFDADLLLEAVDDLVGNDRLFESYDKEPSSNPSDFALGHGLPFESLDAYLDLHELFGEDWLVRATSEYVARWGSEELREDPTRMAVDMVSRARDEFERARATEFECYLAPVKLRVAAAMAAANI